MKLLSVNIGRPRPNPWKNPELTGIDKQAVDGPVAVSAPGPKGVGSVGLAGDRAYDVRNHGGADQAVYAYAREDLDDWQEILGQPIRNGRFGENLTTLGLPVTTALIGERWQIGPDVVLEISGPRIPCTTFEGWLQREGWMKEFTRAARPGAYFRVLQPGRICAGDAVAIVHRPEHEVSIELAFRAFTLEPDLLPQLLVATALPEESRERIRRRTRSV